MIQQNSKPGSVDAESPAPHPRMRRFWPSAVMVLAVFLGGGSLLLLGVFLFLGPPGLLRLQLSAPAALAWDAGLSLIFFVQHSGMIRRSFRARLRRSIPPHYDPAVYSIASGLALFAVILLWQTVPTPVVALPGPWRLLPRTAAVLAIGGFVWGVGALRVFDPFGQLALQAHVRGRPLPQLPLAARGPYQWVRHPLYSCMLVFFWSVPDVSADRLVFDVLWTVWVVVGAIWEERDLVADFGDSYRRYQQRVPMLIPWRGPAGRKLTAD